MERQRRLVSCCSSTHGFWTAGKLCFLVCLRKYVLLSKKTSIAYNLIVQGKVCHWMRWGHFPRYCHWGHALSQKVQIIENNCNFSLYGPRLYENKKVMEIARLLQNGKVLRRLRGLSRRGAIIFLFALNIASGYLAMLVNDFSNWNVVTWEKCTITFF